MPDAAQTPSQAYAENGIPLSFSVGTSGIDAKRSLPVTARTFTCLVAYIGITASGGAIMRCVRPATISWNASGVPLEGMGVIFMPVAFSSLFGREFVRG